MKTAILILGFLFNALLTFGQETENIHFLKADSTWVKEIINFPLSFAPDIPFEGYEDIRFSPDWSKKDSSGFWSYVFAWKINGTINPTEPMLEYYIQSYFDGLMTIGSNSFDENNIQGTTAVFMKREALDSISGFRGKVATYDIRYTNKPLNFNVIVEVHSFEKEKKTIILFRLSPKGLDDAIWDKLKEVKI